MNGVPSWAENLAKIAPYFDHDNSGDLDQSEFSQMMGHIKTSAAHTDHDGKEQNGQLYDLGDGQLTRQELKDLGEGLHVYFTRQGAMHQEHLNLAQDLNAGHGFDRVSGEDLIGTYSLQARADSIAVLPDVVASYDDDAYQAAKMNENVGWDLYLDNDAGWLDNRHVISEDKVRGYINQAMAM